MNVRTDTSSNILRRIRNLEKLLIHRIVSLNSNYNLTVILVASVSLHPPYLIDYLSRRELLKNLRALCGETDMRDSKEKSRSHNNNIQHSIIQVTFTVPEAH